MKLYYYSFHFEDEYRLNFGDKTKISSLTDDNISIDDDLFWFIKLSFSKNRIYNLETRCIELKSFIKMELTN